MELLIRVNENDIRLGIPKDRMQCPIGKALTRQLRFPADVTREQLMIQYDPWHWATFPMPFILSQWMADFDLGRMVRPTEFVIITGSDLYNMIKQNWNRGGGGYTF